MSQVLFITHPDVVIDPAVAVPEWRLSATGLARMRVFGAQPRMRSIGAIWSSAERKAQDGAQVLASVLGLPWQVRQDLGENDRSATGYLPQTVFEAMADAFFAEPEVSVRGWERAADAQARIVAAVRAVIAMTFPPGDIAIVSHGAVGALLQGHLSGRSIDRSLDQPAGNGGNFFAFDRETRRLRHGWMPIDSDIDPTF
jgi:broad specificity phosphatase PhoE